MHGFSVHGGRFYFWLIECCIYRCSNNREDDRCLVQPHVRPSHPALGNIATVGDVGQCSARVLSNLDKGN